MKSRWAVLALALFLIAGCNTSYPTSAYSSNSGYAQSGGFQSLEQSVFQNYCTQCHGSPNTGRAGFAVDSYQDVMNSGYVTPGNANQSQLCSVVYNGQMPPNAQLPQGAADAICNWIQGGAQNN